MLNVYTGRNRLMASALVEALKSAGEETQLVVVPKQLTLQTERMLLEALSLQGSFRIQVLSTQRLCGRIFDAAGQPQGTRIDERGRVMLVRAAIRAAEKQLTIYRGAEHRRGFPERAAAQLERIRQARVNAETLRACAAELSGSARLKLNDLSYILEAYEVLVENRYQDGEAEFGAAIERAWDAAFLRTCSVWFFGFDMVPPTMYGLIAAVAAACPRAGVFLPLENDVNARDFDAFLPMQRSMERLLQAASAAGVETGRIDVEEDDSSASRRSRMIVSAPARKSDLKRLERELFAYPAEPSSGAAKAVQLTLLRDPQEECMFAAALIRRLVRMRSWKWSDVLILCRDLESYSAPLRTAFDRYGVPLFLAASRSAARHVTAECLLTALRIIEKNCLPEDMLALLRTGMTPVSEDEADRFTNYSVKYGLRGSRFLRPLRRGSEAEIEAMEPVRERLTAPIIRLKDRLKRAETLQAQLTALFGFLTDINAAEKSRERMNRLAQAGLREAAGEEGQVWNRIIGAMDQMHALLGEEKLPLSELTETLTESLSASVVKALPQSGDAVYAQSTDGACTRHYRAILVLGASDRPVSDNEGLLTPAQKQALSGFAKAYLGPDDADLSRLRRFYLKSALGMASDYVSVSCPLSGADGSAQRPSAMFEMIAGLFPGTKARGGLTGDESVERMLRGTPEAAVSFIARALADEAEGIPALPSDRAAISALARLSGTDPGAKRSLNRLGAALDRARAADALTPSVAKALYGALHHQSITRLELFASCPFSYYARYGLQPERIESYALNARDEGSFFHDAVNEFLLRSRDDLNALDAETAAVRMDAIADTLLAVMGKNGPLGDSAVSMAQRRRLKSTARVCAAVLADHMRGSRFRNTALEHDFGRGDGVLALTLPGGCVLEGRIDRIDSWSGALDGMDSADYLRVIDYKRGGKTLRLFEVYYGLSLQLPVYLAAAQRRSGARSAGVYYFTLDEGILASQSTDPAAVEAERRKNFRMEGLLPESKELLEAMSPEYKEVLKVGVNAGGTFRKGEPITDESGFAALTRCALARAEGHLQRIRRGDCAAAPARMDKKNPCTYCDYRAICLFDDRLDAKRIRKFKPLPMEEAMLRMKAEDDEDGAAPKENK